MPVPTSSSSYVRDWLFSGDGRSAKIAPGGTKTDDASATEKGRTEPRRVSSESFANPGAQPPPHVDSPEFRESRNHEYDSGIGSWGYSGYPYVTPTYYDPKYQSTYEDTRATGVKNAGYYWNPFPPMACTDMAPVPAKDSTAVIPSQDSTSNALSPGETHPNTMNTHQQPYARAAYPEGAPVLLSTLAPEADLESQELKKIYNVRASRKAETPGPTVSEKLAGTPGEEQMVDIIHDPSTGPKDVTVRMKMEIKEDNSEYIETFSRLKRLGRITEAQALFHDKIDHPDEVSYPIAQYAEMLISAGDYKSFQKLASTPDASKPTANPSGEPHLDKILANLQLLKLLSQPDMPPETYITNCLTTIYELMRTLGAESCFGSTEVQLIVLCLRLLQELQISTRDDVAQEAKKVVQETIRWSDIYQLLLYEERVWDFRDLLVASVPVLGWQEVGDKILEKASFPEILHAIMNDWMESDYDESTTLAFLDLFTSLVLQEVFGNDTDPRISLCLDYARKLSDSVLKNDPQNTRSRPFIQWILAKVAFEMRKSRDSQGNTALQEFPGLLLRQGSGVQLPIFVPWKHLELPNWSSFVIQPLATQESSLQVALKTARFLGDYSLQCICLKLIILQSSEPTEYMDDLATLQLEKQQDKEGFLGTCLAKYLATRPPVSLASVLKDTKQLDQLSGGSYLKRGINASFLWAKSMIREALLSDGEAEETSNISAAPDRESVLREELAIYGPRLPNYIADYVRSKYNVDIPKPIKPYRPAKIRFSDSTVGGKEILGSRKRPKRIKSRLETGNENSCGGSNLPLQERQRLRNRFEFSEKHAAPLPTWVDFPVEGWPPTWRYDAERIAADTRYRQPEVDATDVSRLYITDHPEETAQDSINGSITGSVETDGEVDLEGGEHATPENRLGFASSSECEDDRFPQLAYEDDGWPDFQIPRSFLRDNSMQVTLQSNSDRHASQTYILKGKGRNEAYVKVVHDQGSLFARSATSDETSTVSSIAKRSEKQPQSNDADSNSERSSDGRGNKRKGQAMSELSSGKAANDQVSALKSPSDRSQRTNRSSSVGTRESLVEGDHISTTSEREGAEEAGLDIPEVEEDNDEVGSGTITY